jgi:hypothetical protein
VVHKRVLKRRSVTAMDDGGGWSHLGNPTSVAAPLHSVVAATKRAVDDGFLFGGSNRGCIQVSVLPGDDGRIPEPTRPVSGRSPEVWPCPFGSDHPFDAGRQIWNVKGLRKVARLAMGNDVG